MRVLIVTDRIADDHGAGAVGEALGRGWAQRAPHDDVATLELSDGGPGFVDAVCHTVGDVVTVPVVIHAPLGQEVPAQIALVERAGRRTAYLDASHAAGRHLVEAERLADPTRLTSAGVGELLLAARAEGAERIVLGLGDLACHDGGAGLLRALGAGADLEHLGRVRHEWGQMSLVVAAAGDLPLTGFHGASAALGTEHGLPAEVTQRLEGETGDWTERVDRALPPATDLLTGRRRRPEREPGAGLGGGVGYAVQLLGARTVPGAAFMLDELEVREHLAATLVVLATDVYDWRKITAGVVAETAAAARDAAAPCVVLARVVSVGRREGMSLGISSTYAVRPAETWAELAARVARTWSPPPPAPGAPAGGA